MVIYGVVIAALRLQAIKPQTSTRSNQGHTKRNPGVKNSDFEARNAKQP
jgi:hypothetical protein